MSNINSRLFGSPLPPRVKGVLEQRQLVAKEIQPNESLYTDSDNLYTPWSGEEQYTEPIPKNFTTNQYTTGLNSISDLSSRTPFVRMWTAVELHDYNRDATRIYDTNKYFPDYQKYNDVMKAFTARHQEAVEAGTLVGPIYDAEKQKFYFEEADATKVEGYDYKIYALGNHVLNNLPTTPNSEIKAVYDKIKKGETLTEDEKQIQSENLIFPDEHKVPGNMNEFLKSAAGINSMDSETYGSLGAMKRTTVNFEVHNFADFDSIYNRFFMRPGAQVFIDFGWDTSELYDPEDIMKEQNPQKALFGGFTDIFTDYSSQKDVGKVEVNQGYMDTLVGIVTDYSSKIMPNGTVQCSLTIVSKNHALLNYNLDGQDGDGIRAQIEYIIENLMYFDGLVRVADASGDEELVKAIPEANQNTSAEDLETFDFYLQQLAESAFKSPNSDYIPTGASLLSGVFIGASSTDLYVTIGKLEDFILNQEFGFGDDKASINNPNHNNFEVAWDSSESYTTYDNNFFTLQTMSNLGDEDPPHFLYPKSWYYDEDQGMQAETYTVQVKKASIKGSTDLETALEKDRETKRIPIREIFVSKGAILGAISNASTVEEFVRILLNTINNESGGVLDLRVGPKSAEDGSCSIIDYNFNPKLYDEQGELVSDEDAFKNLFEFDVMSGNSIVKGFDVDFKIPSSQLGSMLAIQGISPKNQIFALSQDTDDILAIQDLFGRADDAEFYIKYLPDMGTYQLDKLTSRMSLIAQRNKDYRNILNAINTSGGSNVSTQYSMDNIDITNFDTWKKEEGLVAANSKTQKEMTLDIVKTQEELLSADNYLILNSVKDFYQYKAWESFSTGERATPLPLNLSLTIYGISNIQPGDTFRVNYLPKLHRENVYFQVIKISQKIDSSGWDTTLETQWRIRPDQKNQAKLRKQPKDTFISSLYLKDTLKLRPELNYATDNDPQTVGDGPDGLGTYSFKGMQKATESLPIYELTTMITMLKPHTPLKYAEVRALGGVVRAGAAGRQPKPDVPFPTWTCEITDLADRNGLGSRVYFPAVRDTKTRKIIETWSPNMSKKWGGSMWVNPLTERDFNQNLLWTHKLQQAKGTYYFILNPFFPTKQWYLFPVRGHRWGIDNPYTRSDNLNGSGTTHSGI